MKKSPKAKIHISVRNQRLTLKSGRRVMAQYPVSTSRFGLGTQEGSLKTPTGQFRVAEAIGHNLPLGTVFKSRQPVENGRKPSAKADAVMTRILWLDGLDPANANTYGRYIYIHGTNHEEDIGKPTSHGCIRMKNADVLELFNQVGLETLVEIHA